MERKISSPWVCGYLLTGALDHDLNVGLELRQETIAIFGILGGDPPIVRGCIDERRIVSQVSQVLDQLAPHLSREQ